MSPTASARKATRKVWDNPILWREVRTWAYGRKILIVRLVYLLLFAIAAASLWSMVQNDTLTKASAAAVLAPFFFLSLILLNAQAVTALTSERDARALDLLLVTDLTPKEIVFGKLGRRYLQHERDVPPSGCAVPLSLFCGDAQRGEHRSTWRPG